MIGSSDNSQCGRSMLGYPLQSYVSGQSHFVPILLPLLGYADWNHQIMPSSWLRLAVAPVPHPSTTTLRSGGRCSQLIVAQLPDEATDLQPPSIAGLRLLLLDCKHDINARQKLCFYFWPRLWPTGIVRAGKGWLGQYQSRPGMAIPSK